MPPWEGGNFSTDLYCHQLRVVHQRRRQVRVVGTQGLFPDLSRLQKIRTRLVKLALITREK